MISLADIKEKICEERGIDNSVPFSSYSEEETQKENAFSSVKNYIATHQEEAKNILDNIMAQVNSDIFPAGETFHDYFTDQDLFNQLKDMRDNDPEKFYTIIRNEELYLNSILRLTKSEAIIHFNLDDLF